MYFRKRDARLDCTLDARLDRTLDARLDRTLDARLDLEPDKWDSGRAVRTFKIGVTLACLAPAAARADYFTRFWETHHENSHEFSLGADLQYYDSNANYGSGSDGAAVTPTNLDHADRTDLLGFGNVGINERLTLYGVLDWRRAEVVSAAAATASPSLISGSSYGLGDQTVGGNYRIYKKEGGWGAAGLMTVDLQFQIDFPGYANSASSTSPYLGDASEDLSFGSFINLPLNHNNTRDILFEGGLGLTYRTAGFSADIPWTAKVSYVPRLEGPLGSLGLFGIQSLKTDANTNNAAAVAGLGSDGSFVSNAVNPSLITIGGQAGYRFKSGTDLTLHATQSFYGQNSPRGFSIGAGLEFHLGRVESTKKPALASPYEYGKSNRGFVNYDIEAKVVKFNESYNVIKIDHGSDDSVQVGDLFDIFPINPDGTGGAAIARCRVTNLKVNEAALSILEYFKEVRIQEGYIARRPITIN